MYRRDAELRVREPDGDERTITLAISRLPQDMEDRLLVSKIGLRLQSPASVGLLTEGAPAARAGIQIGDTLLALNGQAVADFEDFYQTLQSTAAQNPLVSVRIDRAGRELDVAVTAQRVPDQDGTLVFRLGIGPQPMATNTLLQYNPLAALPAAAKETWSATIRTLTFLGDMVTGVISPKHLSGPITIARVANAVAKDGLAWFLGFLGLVSVGIAILNLLPIPILDGGHILSYLIESLKGSPLSERVEMVGQYLGLGALACLIGLAVFNDVMR